MRKVTIAGVEYPIHFSMKALHDFAKGQGVDDVAGAMGAMGFLANFKKGYKLSITDLEKITALAEATIKAGQRKSGEVISVDVDAIYEYLLLSPEAVKQVVEEVVEGLNEYLETFTPNKKKAAETVTA